MVHLRLRNLAALERLLERPEVAAIYEDTRFRLQLAQALPMIGQPAAAAAGHQGAGTAVAVLDSGVDYTRAAFGFCTAPGLPAGCKVIASEDFAPQDNQLDAPELHGTLVSGIVVGVAPETKLAVLDVFDGDQGSFTAILAALDWAIVNRDRYDIASVNMSFGGDEGRRRAVRGRRVHAGRAAAAHRGHRVGRRLRKQRLQQPARGTRLHPRGRRGRRRLRRERRAGQHDRLQRPHDPEPIRSPAIPTAPIS